MIIPALITFATLSMFQVTTFGSLMPTHQPQVLASHTISLDNRYPVKSVSDVFKDNILLTANYLNGLPKTRTPNWEEVRKSATYSFVLQPNEVFAFHEDVYPEFKGKIARTTTAHFNGLEGFKSDGYLMGDGVCHLASLIYWSAKDANLIAIAPTNHNFAVIPQVPREYGVAIFDNPGNPSASANQNLYITNNKTKPVEFKLIFDGVNLTSEISEL